ncbi:hypothetical protein [Fusobacterium ulcerans]|uniref:Uncharacterized protein n=1 Tax=Fusobacterium ulcerans 12-1B TaxID=457404 RepID=H1PNW6_9FUSO|nr:hypothetical protein [Fusobacterium ulcerans]EHO85185.1 hypothetical protein HMPREF0402_00109 [Fusobacterium ulcerans 12-1B]
MTLQEKFNQARQNMQHLFKSALGFRTSFANSTTIKTEIYINDTIIAVGFAGGSDYPLNERCLLSMLNAIANYDLNLIPKE